MCAGADIRVDPRVREQEWGSIKGISPLALSSLPVPLSSLPMPPSPPPYAHTDSPPPPLWPDRDEMAKIMAQREACGRFFYRFPNGESGAGGCSSPLP